MASKKPHQATVEDYFSDDGHGQGVAIEPFTPEPSPGKANVRTKRSNPEDMGTDKTPTGRVPSSSDVKSDSGYSSQSVAGMSSADSAASAASSQRSPPTIPAAPSPTPAQRQPRPANNRQQSSQSSQSASRHPLARRDSHASRQRPAMERRSHAPAQQPPLPKRRDSRNGDECSVPGCTKCGPDAIDSRPRPSRRQSLLHTQPADSAPDVSFPHVYDTRSQVSDPAQYPASSPREGRPPRMYQTSQGGPVVQPATSRRPSVSHRPPRPTSYHGDPNYNNWAQTGIHSPHPGTAHEHGPPLSRSAWGNLSYPQTQMNPPYMPQYPSQGPSPAAFYQAQQMQPPRDQQRPHLQTRAQTSAYGYPPPPVVQVERTDRTMPSARYHPTTLPSFAAQRQQPRIDYRNQEEDDFESESESESESEEEPDYHPQRPQRGAHHQRPSLRHAKTTPAPPVPEARRPQTIVIPEQRNPRVQDRNHDLRSTRRTSKSRPPPIPSVKSQSAYDTPQARIFVEGPRSSRRESLQTYNRTFTEHRRARQHEYNEPARPKRSSRVYETVANGHDYERDYRDDDEEAEPAVRPPRRRRDTDAESRRRSHRPVEVRQADAEDYINARRGERETLADQSYEIAKTRSSRTSGGPSEPESSRSRGSDTNGEIRLRIGNDAPVTLSLNGDMEGRTLQLVPIENGMNELVISGNSRGNESIYRSERGSVRADRRAIMSASHTRREAEEMTEHGSQSSRRRRETRGELDEPRRVLHRSTRRRERREPEYQD